MQNLGSLFMLCDFLLKLYYDQVRRNCYTWSESLKLSSTFVYYWLIQEIHRTFLKVTQLQLIRVLGYQIIPFFFPLFSSFSDLDVFSKAFDTLIKVISLDKSDECFQNRPCFFSSRDVLFFQYQTFLCSTFKRTKWGTMTPLLDLRWHCCDSDLLSLSVRPFLPALVIPQTTSFIVALSQGPTVSVTYYYFFIYLCLTGIASIGQ